MHDPELQSRYSASTRVSRRTPIKRLGALLPTGLALGGSESDPFGIAADLLRVGSPKIRTEPIRPFGQAKSVKALNLIHLSEQSHPIYRID